MFKLLGRWRLRASRESILDAGTGGCGLEDKLDRLAVRREWIDWTSTRSRRGLATYLFAVLSDRTDGMSHRLVRNGRHKDGLNAWGKLHMENAPVTSATAQGFMKKSLEYSPSVGGCRREQLDPDAGGTCEKVRGTRKQVLRQCPEGLQKLYDILPKPD